MRAPRIYHTWDQWECYPAGFYENGLTGATDDQCRDAFRDFLADLPRFERAMKRVQAEWKNSCEHYLTNERMNRIAWLGQSAACLDARLPSKYRSGYFLLSKRQRKKADDLALKYLNKWLCAHGWDTVDMEGAGVSTKVNLY